MENNQILKKLGLSKEESSVYLGLLELGQGTVSAISKHTGLHRPGIYKTLPKLKERGLITEFPKGKQKMYTAEPPEKLRALFEEITKDFESVLPDLETTYKARNKKPVVKFLEGRKGLQFVFGDVVHSLKRGDVFYRYSSAKDWKYFEGKYLPGDYKKVRDAKQLQRLVITNKTGAERAPSLDRAIKLIPQNYDLFDYDVAQIIYGNKIAFVDYNTETALIIENGPIAEFQRKIFKLLYNKL